MKEEQPNILIVDDELHNLEIITEYLDEEAYQITTKHNSPQAWQELEANPTVYDVILLDWMMPELDGLEILARIKQHPDMKYTPVIMQTARTEKKDILRAMSAGAFYFLTKPYNQEMLCGIVKAALDDNYRFKQLERILQQSDPSLTIKTSAEFNLRNLNEADQLASMLANSCPEPEKVISGISELLINAIEHGNLNISYAQKSDLKKHGQWREEIEHRLRQNEFKDKTARIKYNKNDKNISITITDQGRGFEWQKFMFFNPNRAFDCNGRGIAMANMLSFDELHFNEKGNEVTAIIKT